MNSKSRADFPILNQKVNDQDLVYLDNAATSQKPQQVIDAISEYYATSNANVHRGVHGLSDVSTTNYEKARKTIADFFTAQNEELILVRNTTEATNGLAYGWGEHNIHAGDIIVATLMEHHSSLVVWQQLALRKKAKLEIISVTSRGTLDLDQLQELLQKYGNKVKLLATVHVSNTLGTVNPIGHIGALLKKYSRQSRFYVDVAQSAPHMPLSFTHLQKHGVDFIALSGHKMLGPMGIGCLLVRKSILESGEMQPWLFGGGMIESVEPTRAAFRQDNIPELFTAGTPDVASTVGLAAACEYLKKAGMEKVQKHDQKLVEYALAELQKNPRVTIIGPEKAEDRMGLVAFTYEGAHAHDVAQILDSQGVAVRSGHHCTMPLHSHLGLIATVRASFQIYNTTEDIDALVSGLEKVDKVFKLK
jgi:cysteine desulfurase/selenocysteine lyase